MPGFDRSLSTASQQACHTPRTSHHVPPAGAPGIDPVLQEPHPSRRVGYPRSRGPCRAAAHGASSRQAQGPLSPAEQRYAGDL